MLVDKRLWAGKMWKRQYHTNEGLKVYASFVLTCDEEIDQKKVCLKGEGRAKT